MAENDNEKIHKFINTLNFSPSFPPRKFSKCTLFGYFKDKTWV